VLGVVVGRSEVCELGLESGVEDEVPGDCERGLCACVCVWRGVSADVDLTETLDVDV
jgi:hypothetical protein